MPLLKLFIDFKSPASYLALTPTLRLLEELRPEAHWLPFRSTQRAIPEQKDIETVGARHIRVRAQARQDTHLLYAGLQDVEMNYRAIPGETDLALAALLFAGPDPRHYVQAAYTAYWVDQLDLNDAAVVDRILEDAGYEPGQFDAAHYLREVDTAQAAAEELGVVDAPGYLIEDNVFVGREHLPWIRELLSGA